jgi:hypothetical protein
MEIDSLFDDWNSQRTVRVLELHLERSDTSTPEIGGLHEAPTTRTRFGNQRDQ